MSVWIVFSKNINLNTFVFHWLAMTGSVCACMAVVQVTTHGRNAANAMMVGGFQNPDLNAAAIRRRVRDRLRVGVGLLRRAACAVPPSPSDIVHAGDHVLWTLQTLGPNADVLQQHAVVEALSMCLTAAATFQAAHAILKPLYDVLLLTVPREYFVNYELEYAVPCCSEIVSSCITAMSTLRNMGDTTVALRSMCILALLSFNARAASVFLNEDGLMLKAVISGAILAGCETSDTIATSYLHWLSSITSHTECQEMLFRHDAFFILPMTRHWLDIDDVDPSLRLYMAKTLAKITNGVANYATPDFHRVLSDERHELMSTLSTAMRVVTELQEDDGLSDTDADDADGVLCDLLDSIRRLVRFDCHYAVLCVDYDLQRAVVSRVAVRDKNACEMLLRLSSGSHIHSIFAQYALGCTLIGLGAAHDSNAAGSTAVTTALCVAVQHLVSDATPFDVLQDAAVAVAAAVTACASSLDAACWTRVATGLVVGAVTAVLRLLMTNNRGGVALNSVLQTVMPDALAIAGRAYSDTRLLQTCYDAFLAAQACFPDHGIVLTNAGVISSVCASLRIHTYAGTVTHGMGGSMDTKFSTTCCAVLCALLKWPQPFGDREDIFDTATALKAVARRGGPARAGLSAVLLALRSAAESDCGCGGAKKMKVQHD